MSTCVDRGGTFTDVVYVDAHGAVEIRKVRSDEAVVGELARGHLTFGTTVATNALLERTGVPTLLVVTEGFADLARIGDQTRPSLFDPDARWPEPLCQSAFEVGGRVAADGTELDPLTFEDAALLHALDDSGAAAVAVVLLNSHRVSDHELAVQRFIQAHRPDVFVALGHTASPEIGYLARIETTLVDAAITPVLQEALTRDRIPADAMATRSDGSLCPASALRAPDAVLSGPAGGVLAVAQVAAQANVQCRRDVHVPLEARAVQRRVARAVDGVHVGHVVAQQRHHRVVPSKRGSVQRRVLPRVGRVHARSVGREQRLRDLPVAHEGALVQRCLTARVAAQG